MSLASFLGRRNQLLTVRIVLRVSYKQTTFFSFLSTDFFRLYVVIQGSGRVIESYLYNRIYISLYKSLGDRSVTAYDLKKPVAKMGETSVTFL